MHWKANPFGWQLRYLPPEGMRQRSAKDQLCVEMGVFWCQTCRANILASSTKGYAKRLLITTAKFVASKCRLGPKNRDSFRTWPFNSINKNACPNIFPPKKTLRHLQHQTSSAGLSSSHFGVIALAALVQFPKANGKALVLFPRWCHVMLFPSKTIHQK